MAILIEILALNGFIANKRWPKTEQAKLADLDTPNLTQLMCLLMEVISSPFLRHW